MKDSMWCGNYNAGNGIRKVDRAYSKAYIKKHQRVLRLMIKRLERTDFTWRWYYDGLYTKVTQREVNALKNW